MGSGPVSLKVEPGNPDAVTWKLPLTPAENVAAAAEVMVGGPLAEDVPSPGLEPSSSPPFELTWNGAEKRCGLVKSFWLAKIPMTQAFGATPQVIADVPRMGSGRASTEYPFAPVRLMLPSAAAVTFESMVCASHWLGLVGRLDASPLGSAHSTSLIGSAPLG